jgi:predicted TIM-barrel enzyme
MARAFSRKEIIDRLNETTKKGYPIIASGASAGIVAKCAELGGTDLIIVYSTGKSRIMGLPTSRLGDSNAITIEMCHEITNVVKDTPIIGGIEATDPTRMDLDKLLTQFLEAGYSGIINFPTVGMFDSYRTRRESVGLGFAREVELVALCKRRDVFTMTYCFNPKDAIEMAKAGVDCMVAHVGATRGGLTGFAALEDLEACRVADEIIQATKDINPDIICLAHGGPFGIPEDTKTLYENTQAVGFVGASSMERIPIENAVIGVVKEFKAIPLGKN